MKRNGLHIDTDGTKRWYKEDKLHRDDGPALIWADGSNFWYKEGKLHRDDGPAIIYSSGRQEWWKDGNWHRDDGPAVICTSGTHYWYKYDKPYEPSAHDLMVWKMNERRNIERTSH